MKNIFKLMGIAMICGSLMFACGPEENGEEETPTYTITTEVNSAVMGSVSGGGQYKEGSTCTLNAIPNAGHRFVKWQDDNTNNPRVFTVTGDATYTATFELETGVKVTFGSATWNAVYINGVYSASQNAFVIAATQNAASDSYPQIELGLTWEGTPETGTYTGSPSITGTQASVGNPYLWYYSDAEHAMVLGGNSCGDWWNKTVTVDITAFDATALTINLVANATMGNLYEVLDGASWPNVSEQSATLVVNNVQLTSTSKGNMFPAAGKIALR